MRSIFFIQQCFLIAYAATMAMGKATRGKVASHMVEFGRVTKQDEHIENNEVLIRKLLDEDLRFLSFSMSMSMSMPSENPKPTPSPTTETSPTEDPTPAPISPTDVPTYTEETTFSPTSAPTSSSVTNAPTRSPVTETSAPVTTAPTTPSPTVIEDEDVEASVNAPLTAEGSAKAGGGITAAAVALSAAAGVVIVVAVLRKLRPRSVAGFEKCDTDSEGETMANTTAAV